MQNKKEEKLTARDLARMIDVSLLMRDATYQELDGLAQACKTHGFICAYTWPAYTELLGEKLKGTETGIGGAVSYPSGQEPTVIKVAQTEYFLGLGANELDMVMNLGWLKSKRYQEVLSDIRAVKKACGNTPLKVIIEAMMLSDDQIADACKCVLDGGADYVKSGSGFCQDPTTLHHLEIMKNTVGGKIKLKVAGGVRNLDTMMRMYKMGAVRFGIGVSSAVSIIREASAYREGIDLSRIG